MTRSPLKKKKKKLIKQLKEEMFPSCFLHKSLKIKKGKKRKQHSFRQRSCLPVKIQSLIDATYDPNEMHSLHQETFLRHDAWQTEQSDCDYFAYYCSQKVVV